MTARPPPPQDIEAYDRAYKNGWMQAFREWTDCLLNTVVQSRVMEIMERRRLEMEEYDKHDPD